MDNNFYDRLILATVGPLVLVALLALTYSIALARNDGSPRVVAKIKRKHMSTLLLVALFIYSPTSTTVFETFGCDVLDDGIYYLRADYRLECTTPEHRSYQGYAGIMIAVYPVGIPLYLAFWLFRHRHALRGRGIPDPAASPSDPTTSLGASCNDTRRASWTNALASADGSMAPRWTSGVREIPDPRPNSVGTMNGTPASVDANTSSAARSDLTPFAELWEPYKPDRYYWEIVEFFRRVLLTGIGIFVFPGSASQIAVILLLAAGFGVVFEVLAPYAQPRDTWLYRTGYLVVVLSMYLALLLRVDISDDESQSQEIFSILLIVVHCMMIVAVAVEGLNVAKDAWGSMRTAED